MVQNRVFEYFEEISKIPRCSFHEEKMVDYLLNFAKEHGYKAITDKFRNVTIIKEASEGFEEKPGIILQGHTDMVCEKNKNSSHDFDKDPLELIYDGGYLKANGTTLGADNGIAIAMALSILSQEDLKTPRIEFVATATEETGLVGATNYPEDILKGKYFINIDSEEEGILIAGCAGGTSTRLEYDITKENITGNLYTLNIHNLKGGHSGMSIHNKHLNAIKCGGLILEDLNLKGINIVEISGGTKHNAIPREFEVKFISNKSITFEDLENKIEEFKQIESNITIDLVDNGLVTKDAFSKDLTNRIIETLVKLPHGVKSYMNGEYSEIVESSLNIAIIETLYNSIQLTISVRSSKNEKRDEIVKDLEKIANQTKGNFKILDSYKAWEFKEDSKLRDIAVEAYEEYWNKNLAVSVIHAGLECAIFGDKYKNIDAISIGPNIQQVHTTEEKLDIESTKRTYEFLVYLIKKLS